MIKGVHGKWSSATVYDFSVLPKAKRVRTIDKDQEIYVVRQCEKCEAQFWIDEPGWCVGDWHRGEEEIPEPTVYCPRCNTLLQVTDEQVDYVWILSIDGLKFGPPRISVHRTEKGMWKELRDYVSEHWPDNFVMPAFQEEAIAFYFSDEGCALDEWYNVERLVLLE